MKINKYFYLTALLILIFQFSYLLDDNFSILDYLIIAGTTILYGAFIAFSFLFVESGGSE